MDFWSNHLNVTNPSDRVWDNRADYDRTVIRKFALDNFLDMLVASATHPAMLQYLNNAARHQNRPERELRQGIAGSFTPLASTLATER